MSLANLVENLQYISIGPGRNKLSSTCDDDRVRVEDICEKIADEPWIAAIVHSEIKHYSTSGDPSTCMGKIFSQCDRTLKAGRTISPEGCHIFVYSSPSSPPYHQHIEPGSDKTIIYLSGKINAINQSHRQLLDSLGVFKAKIMKESEYGYIPMTSEFVDINDIQVVPDPNEAGELALLMLFMLMVFLFLVRPDK